MQSLVLLFSKLHKIYFFAVFIVKIYILLYSTIKWSFILFFMYFFMLLVLISFFFLKKGGEHDLCIFIIWLLLSASKFFFHFVGCHKNKNNISFYCLYLDFLEYREHNVKDIKVFILNIYWIGVRRIWAFFCSWNVLP